jgi:hypothetical protein
MLEKPYKKIPIYDTLKCAVWYKYIGETVGKAKCMCCNLRDIWQNDHHCGHIQAESKGGKNELENLRPICAKCNQSMRNTHMIEYQRSQGFPLLDLNASLKHIPCEKVEQEKIPDMLFHLVMTSKYDLNHFICKEEDLQGYVLRMEKIDKRNFVVVMGKLPLDIFTSPPENYKELLQELTEEEIIYLSDKYKFMYIKN